MPPKKPRKSKKFDVEKRKGGSRPRCALFRKSSVGIWYVDIALTGIVLMHNSSKVYDWAAPVETDTTTDSMTRVVAKRVNGRILNAGIRKGLRNKVQEAFRHIGCIDLLNGIRWDLCRAGMNLDRGTLPDNSRPFAYIWGYTDGQGLGMELTVSGVITHPEEDTQTMQYAVDYDPAIQKFLVDFCNERRVNPGDVVMFALARIFTEFQLADFSALARTYGVLADIRRDGIGMPNQPSIFTPLPKEDE